MLNKLYHENLATLGDWLVFEPFDGRRNEMKLTRTKVEIFLFKGGNFQKSPCQINFRSMGETGAFLITLKRERDQTFYELKSLGKEPFLHNGNPTFHSRLRRNDRIDLEFNRFVIRSESEKERELTLPLKSWPEKMFVNLEGETGTGKTTLARRLHEKYVGENHPFIHINLSAFSESLLESELFGHEKGSFTGATKERRGAIERANKGTLFIDELDSIPLHLQVKLLTFLDDGSFQRVGGERFLKSNCRVIFASGRPLKSLMDREELRKDLFYRITSGFSFYLKPLRENREQIRDIIEAFEIEKNLTVSKELKNIYLNYNWPGNIRQLRSHLLRKMYECEKSTYLVPGTAEEGLVESLIDNVSSSNEIISLKRMKERYCKTVLANSFGSVDDAAKKLEISVNTLRKLAS